METGSYSYLAKEPYENFEKDFGRDRLSEVWANIYKEYCEMTNDNRALEYYRLKRELLYLETRRVVAGKLFAQITMRNMPREVFMEYIKELKAWEFRYRKKKKDISELEDLGRQIKQTLNRINMTKAKLESFNTDEKPVDIIKQVVQVEHALGKNSLDPETTSVTKWVRLMEQIREINAQREKQKNGRK